MEGTGAVAEEDEEVIGRVIGATREIGLLNLFRGLRPVRRAGAIRDVLAGVALAATDIPQVLGYSKIAGMPVVTGLYTLLLPVVAFAAFGSSRYLVVAADSASAAIFAGGVDGWRRPAMRGMSRWQGSLR